MRLRLAACAQRRGDDDRALSLQLGAIAALDEGVPSHWPTLAAAYNNVGITRLRTGDASARAAFERAVELRTWLRDVEGYCLAAANLVALEEDPREVAKGVDWLPKLWKVPSRLY